LSYDPTLANAIANNHDAWSIELVAGSGALDHSETIVDGNLTVAAAGAVIWVSSSVPSSATDTAGFIHAIGHDPFPGAIGSAPNTTMFVNTLPQGKVLQNTAADIVSLAASSTSTMSAPNGGANDAWIVNTLRGAPEPSRSLLCLAGLLVALLTRRRRV
jgi:hypothetical protein